MNMEILPSTEDSDAYLSDNIIVHTFMDNDIDDRDCNSQSE